MSWKKETNDTQVKSKKVRWQGVLASALAIIVPFLIFLHIWNGGGDVRQESIASVPKLPQQREPTFEEAFDDAAAMAPPGVEAIGLCRDAELFRELLVGGDYGPLENPKLQMFATCIGQLAGKIQCVYTYHLWGWSEPENQIVMLHVENSLPELLGELPVDLLGRGHLRTLDPGIYALDADVSISVRIIDGADCPDLPKGRILLLMGPVADSLDLAYLGRGDARHLRPLLKLVPAGGKSWTVFDTAPGPDKPAMQGASYFDPDTALFEIWLRTDTEEDAERLIQLVQEAREGLTRALDNGLLPPGSALAERLRRTLSNSRFARKGRRVRLQLDLPMGIVPAMIKLITAARKQLEQHAVKAQRRNHISLLVMLLQDYWGAHGEFPESWAQMIRGLDPRMRDRLVTSSVARPLDKMYLYKHPGHKSLTGPEVIILEAPAMASGSRGGFSGSLENKVEWHEEGQYLEKLKEFGVEPGPEWPGGADGILDGSDL